VASPCPTMFLHMTKKSWIAPPPMITIIEGVSPRNVGGLSSSLRATRRLLAEEREAHDEELRVLAQKLLEAQEAARLHLARELHDDIGQTLTGLGLLLDRTSRQAAEAAVREELGRARKIVVGLMQHVRRTARNLRPSMLDDLGLLVALQAHIKEFHLRTGVSVGFTWETFVESQVPPPIKLITLRVVQEALMNVARHAQVPHVMLAIRIQAAHLRITVCDLGCGFDMETDTGGGSGLLGMRERVQLVEGTIQIESVPGRGTRVCVQLPLNSAQKGARQ
jgi:signal transduction histidine kinase